MAVAESASVTSASSTPTFLPWSSLLCQCLQPDRASQMTAEQLYHEHGAAPIGPAQRCSWFTQNKRVLESRLVKEHVQKEARKAKEKAKVEREEARLIKKAEGFTCRRCKAKFESNTKLHEHVRTRHAKKSKAEPAAATKSKTAGEISEPSNTSPASSVIAPSASMKLTPEESPAPHTSFELVSSPSTTLEASVPVTPLTSPKMYWAAIAAKKPLVPRPSRLPVSVRVALPTPPSTPVLEHHITASKHQKPYLTMDELFRMFAGKPRPFGLQQRQINSCSPRTFGNSHPTSYQARITAYFKPLDQSELSNGRKPRETRSKACRAVHAPEQYSARLLDRPQTKSFKSEVFRAVYAPDQQSARVIALPGSATSAPRFSNVSWPSHGCRHCQRHSATYWPSNRPVSSATRAGIHGDTSFDAPASLPTLPPCFGGVIFGGALI